MKLSFISLFFVSIMFSFTCSATQNFTINDQTTLNDLKGKVVYLDFWASWCKPCHVSFPWMNEMHAKYKAQGLEIIAVNLDEDTANAKAYLQKLPANFTVVFDPQAHIAQQYEIIGMPSSFIIDKQGNLRASHQGFFLSKKQAYEKELQILLAE